MSTLACPSPVPRLYRQGSRHHRSLSYPVRVGLYHEIRLGDTLCHLGLDGFPRFAQGTGPDWPHPQEWLKLTRAGDHVYYSSEGYGDLHDLTGEYYYPLLPYPSNPLYPGTPQDMPAVRRVMEDHDPRCRQALDAARGLRGEAAAVLRAMGRWTMGRVRDQAAALHRLIRARVPVLPPDSRHADYDVIPLVLAEGCLANCGFCRIKSGAGFRVRSPAEISAQLHALKEFWGRDLPNCRALFLGQHDALAAGAGAVARAVEQAMRVLGLGQGHVDSPVVFCFGSTRSFLQLGAADLERLADLPARLYINLGLESLDQASLDLLRKPLRATDNLEAAARAMEVNRGPKGARISLNMVVGPPLGQDHEESLADFLAHPPGGPAPGTTVYLSPLAGSAESRVLRALVRRLRSRARVETRPYLIQRL